MENRGWDTRFSQEFRGSVSGDPSACYAIETLKAPTYDVYHCEIYLESVSVGGSEKRILRSAVESAHSLDEALQLMASKCSTCRMGGIAGNIGQCISLLFLSQCRSD